jgi:hypothetical protein
MGDARDNTTWLAVELTSLGERHAEKGDLETLLRGAWGLDADHPIFIPCVVLGGSILNGMEGYVFVGSDLPPLRHTQTLYTRKVLAGPSGSCATIPNAKVCEIRETLQELLADEYREGDTVRIRSGRYRGITGSIVEIRDGHAAVLISLRSLRALPVIPLIALDPGSE